MKLDVVSTLVVVEKRVHQEAVLILIVYCYLSRLFNGVDNRRLSWHARLYTGFHVKSILPSADALVSGSLSLLSQSYGCKRRVHALSMFQSSKSPWNSRRWLAYWLSSSLSKSSLAKDVRWMKTSKLWSFSVRNSGYWLINDAFISWLYLLFKHTQVFLNLFHLLFVQVWLLSIGLVQLFFQIPTLGCHSLL